MTNDKIQAAHIAWARLDRALRHTTEPGDVLRRLQIAERKAYTRWRDLIDHQKYICVLQ